jgi:hypothetical protein
VPPRSFPGKPIAGDWTPPKIDTSRPHTARMYDYYLGGKTNYPVDRALAERVLSINPGARTSARENRMFLGRVVTYLAGTAGIRQFLDIGTGIPTPPNTYDIAKSVAPESRVVYVDNDPIVLAHARALLGDEPAGTTAYVLADLRDPDRVLAAAGEVLDFSRPVAILLTAILHFVTDEDRPREIIERYLAAVPPGSFMAASHLTTEFDPVGIGNAVSAYLRSGIMLQARTCDEFEDLVFRNLTLIEPGVTLVSEWRSEASVAMPSAAEVSCFGGLARKS